MFWEEIRYFKPREFDSPDQRDSGLWMDEALMRRLDALRDKLGYPLVVSSGFRSRRHNLKVGGAPDSAHCLGLAVDLLCGSDDRRYSLISSALALGFTRVGIYPSHLHLDLRLDKPQQVIWVGK